MSRLDKRLHAYRDDLADVRLQGRVGAAKFVSGVAATCGVPLAGVHRAPSADAMQLTQVLYGEALNVFERAKGWAWVQLQRDGYVGYVEESALGNADYVSTHKVVARSTQLYPKADLKTQPAVAIPMLSELMVKAEVGDYLELTTGQFVFAAHVSAQSPEDFVSVAEQFLHTPYLWGGKTVWGIDCSGLVQVALQACNMQALRDSDMQEHSLGGAVSQQNLQRGDLVFWKGHVGIMQNAETLLHANGHHMMVVSEPLADAVTRIAAKGSEITAVRRLPIA
jgi:cell wall-associated NlpC family hydrolase